MNDKPRPATGIQAGEVIYFDRSGVLVSSKRVAVGGTVYPLKNITSVSAVGRERRGVNRAATRKARIATVCGMAAMSALLAVVFGVAQGEWLAGFVSGCFLLLAGSAVAVPLTKVHSFRAEYGLVLATAGRDVEAVWSKNEQLVADAVDAINEAIVG